MPASAMSRCWSNITFRSRLQRADVVLAGTHPRTGEASYVIVELKQWSAAYTFEGDPEIVEVPGVPGGPRSHPVIQVRGYCEYLLDFARVIADRPDSVAGMAYLHNASDPALVKELLAVPVSTTGRLFTAADKGAMFDFLRSRLAPVPGRQAADLLINSPVAPSKQLLKLAAAEIRDRSQFRLIGNQQLAVDLVMHAVEHARAGNAKRVIAVTGGPGSGKSVIALSLVGELARRGRTVIHATGSRSFTQTLRKVAAVRAPKVRALFKYFNQFMTADPNGLDVLIMDEAHRIRQTSVDRYTPESRTDRLQIDERIAAARVPSFCSKHQVGRPGETGTLEQIEHHAQDLGLDFSTLRSANNFGAAGAKNTCTGWSDFWDSTAIIHQRCGPVIRSSMSASLRRLRRWNAIWQPRCRRDTPRVSPPGIAGRGAMHARTEPSP